MPYELVSDPIPGPGCFRVAGDEATQAQAAVLLLVGVQQRGDDWALNGRAAAADLEPLVEALPGEDLARFPVPRLRPGGERVSFQRAQFLLVERYGPAAVPAPSREVSASNPQFSRDVLGDLAQRFYESPTPTTAAQLMEFSLTHSDPLVRVAAAASYFDLSAEPSRLIPVLEEGTRSTDELVRDVAATALGRIAPAHPSLGALTVPTPPRGGGRPSRTSALIHGTFARNAAWWQPGGGFHAYILGNVRPDLYGANDRFEWSGGYSDEARAVAAEDLHAWITGHGFDQPGLFAHSHGASVAMLASQHFGLNIGTLVLLSCPVHPHKYMPDFNSVARVVSVRVRFDLVILADRGGQRFRHPQINENVLPIWFNHSATHEPPVWQQHNVPAML